MRTRIVPASATGSSALRDPAMDLVRVTCVCLVVVGHLLMVGASLDPIRGLLIERTLLSEPWFGPLTWIVQIMPLFFVVGGFAGYGSWMRSQAAGGTAADFIRTRVLRLARPAVPLFIALSIAIVVMHLCGVPAEAVSLIGAGVTSPLWFLAAYAFAQAYLPTMATLHARFPVATITSLAVCAAAWDVLRFATGVEPLGILNMIFVWLFVQQLGFWIADGWFGRQSRPLVAGLGVAAYGVLALLVWSGYPSSMLDNLNPPTFAIVALATGQTCLLVLVLPGLRRAVRPAAVRAVVATIGARLMTIYLWHLPVLGLVVGLLLISPLPTPRPGSAEWWWSRPVILAVVAAVLTAISAVLGRLERPSPNPPGVHAGDGPTGLAAALVVLPPFLVMLFGVDFLVASTSAILLGGAVYLQRPMPSPVASGPDPVTS